MATSRCQNAAVHSGAGGRCKHVPSNWKSSIMQQLQLRKTIEQAPFVDICSYASNLFDCVDIYKSENIQLNLQREQLQQELLGIQQTILAGGSVAAKTVLSKLPSSGQLGVDEGVEATAVVAASKNLSLQHASLLAEKSQLEKKILNLQENLAEALKSKSDTVQKFLDLKTELDEKHRSNKQLELCLEEKERELDRLRDALDKLDSKHNTMTDEHLALTLSYKSLEKKFHLIKIENDALSQQILAVKREDADRMNAENDRIMMMQQDRRRREIESNVHELTALQMAKQAVGDPLTLAAMAADNFETFEDEYISSLRGPARIPTGVEFSFEAHEGETCTVFWYYCSGPRDNYLATGGTDRKVKLWRVIDGGSSSIATLEGSNLSITSLDVEADAILASSNDCATRIWSVTDHTSRRTLTGHSSKVWSAKFLGTPNKVGSGSSDRTVKIWDITQGACVKTYFAGSSCFDVVYNSSQFITGHFDSRIRFWDLKRFNDSETVAQILLQAKITSLDVSRDGTKLLCSLRDNTIKYIDMRKLEVMRTFSDEKFKIGSDNCRAKFSNDGQYITCGSSDGSVYIWDTNTAKVEKILTGHNTTVFACCWSPDGKKMVSIEKGKVSIWN